MICPSGRNACILGSNKEKEMAERITLHASDLDGFLTDEDQRAIDEVAVMYGKSMALCRKMEDMSPDAQALLAQSARDIGHRFEAICRGEDRIHVYSFETPATGSTERTKARRAT